MRRSNDWQLIRRYLNRRDVGSFEKLMQRHYDTSYSYVLARSPQQREAAFLTQKVWTSIVERLPTFEPQMDFEPFLFEVSNEVITEFQHDQAKTPAQSVTPEPATTPAELEPQAAIEPHSWPIEVEEKQLDHRKLRAMSCQERMAYLLKKVSDSELKIRLSWEDLAAVTGLDTGDVWDRFEFVRKTILMKHHFDTGKKRLECEDLLIFLVWTQANQPERPHLYSWHYFSELTGIPTLQLQLDYRSAVKKMSEELNNGNN